MIKILDIASKAVVMMIFAICGLMLYLIATSKVAVAQGVYPPPVITGGMVCQQPMQFVNGRWYCPGGFVSSGGTVIIPQQQGIHINVGGGGTINSCSAIGGILGGTAGSFANNHTLQAVIIGAVLGGTIGNMVCSEGGRDVRYLDSQARRTVVPTTCKIDGVAEEIRGVSRDMCAKIASTIDGRITEQKTEVSPDQVVIKHNTGTATSSCAWINPDTKVRHDRPEGDTRPCVDFVKEVAAKNGFKIATRQ